MFWARALPGLLSLSGAALHAQSTNEPPHPSQRRARRHEWCAGLDILRFDEHERGVAPVRLGKFDNECF